jgi:hypothetical protein
MSRGVTYIPLPEIALNPLRLFWYAAQSADSSSGQSKLVTGWRATCHPMFEIGVEQFVRVQFRRVNGKIEDFDFAGVGRKPSFTIDYTAARKSVCLKSSPFHSTGSRFSRASA